jgi:hypothetical protein
MGLNADPGFYITLDLTTATKEGAEKSLFIVATYTTTMKIILFLNRKRKTFEPIYKEL